MNKKSTYTYLHVATRLHSQNRISTRMSITPVTPNHVERSTRKSAIPPRMTIWLHFGVWLHFLLSTLKMPLQEILDPFAFGALRNYNYQQTLESMSVSRGEWPFRNSFLSWICLFNYWQCFCLLWRALQVIQSTVDIPGLKTKAFITYIVFLFFIVCATFP